jgi:hypothetical protein
MVVDAAHRFQRISRQARPYPSYLLPEDGQGLLLFAAGFLGWNDAVHFVRAGMTATCVDTNEEKLREMSAIYPLGWAFRAEDAWEFAEHHREHGIMYDAVSVDPFFEDLAVRTWESLELWLSLARELVTLTVHADTELEIPQGWKSSYFPRGSNVGWLVMQRV